MTASDNAPSFFHRWLRPLLIGTAVGILCCTLLFLLAALVIRSVDIPAAATVPLALTVAAVSTFTAGAVSAALAGSRGWLMGLLTGAVIVLLILVAGIIRTGTPGERIPIKAVLLPVSGTVGGMIGVGLKHR